MSSGAGSGQPFRCGFVALVGWTNVGKSTLLNRLLGTKLAAVADVSQTTRQRIVGVRHIAGRGQLAFVDTPGLHRPRYRMNRAMLEVTREAMSGVDLALLVIDAGRGLGAGDREGATLLRRAGVDWVVALNKVDRVRPKSLLLPMMRTLAEEWGCSEAVPISALTGEGCETLLELLLGRLPEAPAAFEGDYLTDQPERALVAERIREKLLAATREELPHATAIVIESWEERADGLLAIEATVLVDKESQKKIVIGREGELLKRVGTAARRELEEFLQRRVFLGLWVKVRRDWRNDEKILRQLGLA